MEESFFLNRKKCKELLTDKKIFIFGTGVDAEQAERELAQYAIVLAYIDNNRYGIERFFNNKNIISLEQALEIREKNQPIIIATYRFAIEICAQLKKANLLPELDFFVWDSIQLFHYDDSTINYIRFLRNLWIPYKKEHDVRKILVMFDNKHDLLSTICAYCANYFAEKNNAAIYGYFRFGANCLNASNVIKDIYKAFNMRELIVPDLNEEQKREADIIYNNIWNNLSTWEDWKNITIYGICFGTTIVRHLLRTYIPTFDLKDSKMSSFLIEAIQTIVFWYHYIFGNDIKAVLLGDGVSWDGYIRDIAITKGIPTYAIAYKMRKMTLNFCDRASYPYFKEMWEQLTQNEQVYGMEWAKEHIRMRLQGGTDEVFYTNKNNFTFSEKRKSSDILEKNDKIKIVICPHIFEEDCYWCGEQIFDNNYFAWLCHLGELSNITPDYDWYLKMHPFAQRRDMMIIDMLLKKYPYIKKIPSNISPLQLKEEGVNYALTVYGTIGHEYPEIGIQVINAGINPHSSFDFTWNPKTKEEYDDLILNLDKLEKKIDEDDLYKFYSLNYLYYDWEYIPYRSIFFDNPFLAMDKLELQANGKDLGTWKYDEYMKEWTKEKHEKIWIQLEKIFNKLDEWKPNKLYKRQESVE